MLMKFSHFQIFSVGRSEFLSVEWTLRIRHLTRWPFHKGQMHNLGSAECFSTPTSSLLFLTWFSSRYLGWIFQEVKTEKTQWPAQFWKCSIVFYLLFKLNCNLDIMVKNFKTFWCFFFYMKFWSYDQLSF